MSHFVEKRIDWRRLEPTETLDLALVMASLGVLPRSQCPGYAPQMNIPSSWGWLLWGWQFVVSTVTVDEALLGSLAISDCPKFDPYSVTDIVLQH